MAKYITQKSIKENDFWYEGGKIHISAFCTQKELEILFKYNVDGIIKIEEAETGKDVKTKKQYQMKTQKRKKRKFSNYQKKQKWKQPYWKHY